MNNFSIIKLLLIIIIPVFLSGCCCCGDPSSSSFNFSNSGSPSSHNKGKSYEQAMQGSKPVVIKFYTDWCGSCKKAAPTFEDVRNQYSDKAEFVMVNGDQNPALVQEYGINAYPTVFLVNPETSAKTEVPYSLIFNSKSFIDFLDQNIQQYKPVSAATDEDFELAKEYYANGNYEKAVYHYERALELYPDNTVVKQSLENAREKLKNN